MIYGERVKQARELRKLTQAELAERVNTSQSYIAHIETNRLQPSQEILLGIAMQTGFPVSFFRDEPTEDFPLGSLMFRSRKMAAPDIAEVHRFGEVMFGMASKMIRKVNTPPLRLPRLSGESPARAAQMTRAVLGLSPDTPIRNLVLTIEKAGVLVLMLPIPMTNGDAYSVWTNTEPPRPIIVLSSRTFGDRLRLSLAHEVGHLVLHQAPNGTTKIFENDAFRFAVELLVPKVAMHHEITLPLTLSNLAGLKARWGVSMHALAYHALKIGLINENQYKYLREQLRQRGWLEQEPPNLNAPLERPRAVRKMAELLYGKPVDYQRLAADSHFTPLFARQIIEAHASREDLPRRADLIDSTIDTGPGLPPPPNVAEFRQKTEGIARLSRIGKT